ncbi:hypothetical protein T439DRAFT_64711 [Meredithblackwellia eburnea MCA 4105]
MSSWGRGTQRRIVNVSFIPRLYIHFSFKKREEEERWSGGGSRRGKDRRGRTRDVGPSPLLRMEGDLATHFSPERREITRGWTMVHLLPFSLACFFSFFPP